MRFIHIPFHQEQQYFFLYLHNSLSPHFLGQERQDPGTKDDVKYPYYPMVTINAIKE